MEAMLAGASEVRQADPLGALRTLAVHGLTRLAADTRRPVTEVAGIGFAAAEHLRIAELKARAGALKITDYYDRLAVNGAISTLDAAARGLTRDVLRDANGEAGDFAAWARSHAPRLAPAKSALDDIVGTGEITVSRLTVAAGQVRELVAG